MSHRDGMHVYQDAWAANPENPLIAVMRVAPPRTQRHGQ